MARSDEIKNTGPKHSADEALDRLKGKPKAYEKLQKVVKHPKLQAALDEFQGNPEKRKEAAQDVAGYLRRKGIDIPEGVEVQFKDDNWSIWLCYRDDAGWTCCLWFDWYWGWGVGCS